MKKKVIIIFLVIIPVLWSCNKNENDIKNLEVIKTNHEIVLKNANDGCFPLLIEDNNNNNYFLYLSKNDSVCLYIVGIDTPYYKRINMDLIVKQAKINNLNLYRLYEFNFLNKIIFNKLYFISDDKEIMSLNIENSEFKKIKIYGNIEPQDVDFHIYAIRSSPFIYQNDSTFIMMIIRHINQSTAEGRKKYFSFPLLGRVYFKPDSALLENIDIPFPYAARKSDDYYMDQQLSYCNDKRGNILYLLNRYDYVYKYNVSSNVIDSFKIPSKFISQNQIVPLNDDYFNLPNYTSLASKYGYEVPKYRSIKYNKYKNLFFRVNTIKTPYYQPNGEKTKYRNWSISVMDSTINLIGEIPFLKDSIYDYRFFYPTKKGFILVYTKTKNDIRLKQLRLCEFEMSN